MSTIPKRVQRRGSAKVYGCPVQLTLDVVSGKWKSHVLWELRSVARGFNELANALDGVSHKVLTRQLRELERDGLIARSQRGSNRTAYVLTPFGRTLRPSLDALARWAKAHHDEVGVELQWSG